MIQFTNTESRRKEEFRELNEGRVTMYTCGPTVYNFAHIGNFRAILTYDLAKRWLRSRGYAVRHVMNITDVDDKTIRDSQKEGTPLRDFTERFAKCFFEDCRALRVAPPDVTPRATDHIPEMLDLIQILMDKGIAYKGEDGSVYFSIEKYEPYGKLSHLKERELKVGARVQSDEYDKESVSDFALWKAWVPQDGDVKWESHWGPGRPGWHLECSVMARKYLGDTIDLHMGGEDLIFPHHENEIAQSEAATGKPFVKYWVHNGYLMVEGKKMSKSAGNFYTLRDIFEKGYTGREVRLLLLSTYYRQAFNFTFEGLHAMRSALSRLDDLRDAMAKEAAEGESCPVSEELLETLKAAKEKWDASLDDDLNTSAAFASLFEAVKAINKLRLEKALGKEGAGKVLEFLDYTDQVLAVAEKDKKEEEFPPRAQELLAERTEARKAKNWPRADEIRNELAAMGLTVEDTPEGPRLKKLG
ncbi:cysteine--tRNA ligase [bacterium]|nr:cysteine--tRNA ligase [bacterium]